MVYPLAYWGRLVADPPLGGDLPGGLFGAYVHVVVSLGGSFGFALSFHDRVES